MSSMANDPTFHDHALVRTVEEDNARAAAVERSAIAHRFRTIVADPPWPFEDFGKRTLSTAGFWAERHVGQRSRTPYKTMTVEEIAALPVDELAEDDAHLYLWTINRHLEAAYGVLRAWGFPNPPTVITWGKSPRGLGFGGAYVNTTEFVLFARRGSLPALTRMDSTWFNWRRPYENGVAKHSAKPDEFLDMVEQVSPAPRLEMFARKGRLGWDYWGDEALQTVELSVTPKERERTERNAA